MIVEKSYLPPKEYNLNTFLNSYCQSEHFANGLAKLVDNLAKNVLEELNKEKELTQSMRVNFSFDVLPSNTAPLDLLTGKRFKPWFPIVEPLSRQGIHVKGYALHSLKWKISFSYTDLVSELNKRVAEKALDSLLEKLRSQNSNFNYTAKLQTKTSLLNAGQAETFAQRVCLWTRIYKTVKFDVFIQRKESETTKGSA